MWRYVSVIDGGIDGFGATAGIECLCGKVDGFEPSVGAAARAGLVVEFEVLMPFDTPLGSFELAVCRAFLAPPCWLCAWLGDDVAVEVTPLEVGARADDGVDVTGVNCRLLETFKVGGVSRVRDCETMSALEINSELILYA